MMFGSWLLGEIEPGTIAVMIPLVLAMIPIVAILSRHQQKMAEIIHGSGNPQMNEEIAQLRQEVMHLKQLVHQQTIALDSVTSSARQMPEAPIQRRLEEV